MLVAFQRVLSLPLQIGIITFPPTLPPDLREHSLFAHRESSSDHVTNSSPSSTLINGLGRYQGGPNSTLAVVGVTQGKRYGYTALILTTQR